MKRKITKKRHTKTKHQKKKRSRAMAEPKTVLSSGNQAMVKTWNERSLSATDRAQCIVYEVVQHGLDYVPAIAQLIQDNDESEKSASLIKSLGHEPLVTERYLGPATVNGLGAIGCAVDGVKYVWVTSRDGVSCLPCSDEKGLQVGDLIVISPKAQRIVGKDGDLASCGSVATVEAVPEESQGQVVVKTAGDVMQVAWLHHTLRANPPVVGAKVIYDEKHRFVLAHINTDTKGDELLSALANLPIVRRADVGSPHPIAEQIVNHFRDAVEHPEWLDSLASRDRKSYLFIGQTGGGKSYHIKLIATEIHDLLEQHTGTRHSRVFMCDASQFWSPYFGDTEQRINSWAKKISKLGSQKIKDRDGNELAVPLLGVIEECEALFRSRGGDQHASGHLFDRVLSLLLQKLESLEDALCVPIVWVCSTNRPDMIDAAAIRRIGMRKAVFGNLKADAARLVMLAKTAKLQVDSELLAKDVTDYLYKTEDVLAEVTFQNGKKRPISRSELVTPAILEEAVSDAVDKCLSASRVAGELQKVSSAHVTAFLDSHFNHLAGMLTRHNLPEYCPEWFAENATPVASIQVVR